MNLLKQKVIIFGFYQIAKLAKYYLDNDSEFEVVAFTVHKEFMDKVEFEGKSIYNYEDLEKYFDPNEYYLFAPMTGKGLNKIREKVYLEGKYKGFKFISYISSKATVFTKDIGENCFILEDNTIQPFTKIGNNVVLWSGNHIGHDSIIEDSVFITSHCVISGNCLIKKYSWLGVNSTLRNNIVLEEGSLIAMSASITKNTEPYKVYMGVPGKICGDSSDEKIAMSL